MSATEFVLQDSLESKRREKPVYLGGMTPIGPCYTEELTQAQRFISREDAMQSPALFHSLCFFEPQEIKK